MVKPLRRNKEYETLEENNIKKELFLPLKNHHQSVSLEKPEIIKVTKFITYGLLRSFISISNFVTARLTKEIKKKKNFFA